MTIVDLGRMVVDPKSADLTLEMNITHLTHSYGDMKECERKRLQRTESQMGENPRRP